MVCFKCEKGGEFVVEDFIKMRDGFSLAITRFDVDDPVGIVQIVHGAKEHRKRYYKFCEFLNSAGFTVIISDNRGHGESISCEHPLGHMNSYQEIVDDLHEISLYIKNEYKGLPLYMFGHSLGSVFARCYLEEYDEEIDKLIISGTVNYRKEVIFGLILGKIIMALRGKKSFSKIMTKLGEWEDDSWINSDPDIMRKVRKDPLCVGYKYTVGGIYTIWKGDYELHQYKNFACRNKNLPILSISGEKDPITGGTSGLVDSISSLERVGYIDVSQKVYEGFKHELTNCRGNDHILSDIIIFLKKSVDKIREKV